MSLKKSLTLEKADTIDITLPFSMKLTLVFSKFSFDFIFIVNLQNI